MRAVTVTHAPVVFIVNSAYRNTRRRHETYDLAARHSSQQKL